MLLPETLLEIVPDELALPLVPPVVVLTLTPLAFVFVSVVVIVAEVFTDVEQAPLHDALPLVATVPVASDTVLRAWLRTPSPLAKTGDAAMSVKAATAAIHTIILRFISSSPFPDFLTTPADTARRRPPLSMTNLRPAVSFLNRGAGQRGRDAASLRPVFRPEVLTGKTPMGSAGLIAFCAAYAVAAASPGPGIAAVLARVLGRGLRGVPAFIAGFVVGDLFWFTIAATGLALLAQAFAMLFVAIKYAGAAYLLYLAWKLWTAPAQQAEVALDRRSDGAGRLFLGGLAVTLGNPKVIVFFLALLPLVIDLEKLSVVGFLEIAALIVVILSAVLSAYALAAASARRLIASPRTMRAVNRTTGTVMAGAAVTIVAR